MTNEELSHRRKTQLLIVAALTLLMAIIIGTLVFLANRTSGHPSASANSREREPTLTQQERELLALREEWFVWSNRQLANARQGVFWAKRTNDLDPLLDVRSRDQICARELNQIENEIERRWGRNAKTIRDLSPIKAQKVGELSEQTMKMLENNLKIAGENAKGQNREEVRRIAWTVQDVCQKNIFELELYLKLRSPRITTKSKTLIP